MRATAILLLMLLAPCAHADLVSVLTCLRANLPQGLRVGEIEFSRYDAAGHLAVSSGALIADRHDGTWRAVFRVALPADLRGSAWLLRRGTQGDEVYSYLPSLGKVRRLDGSDLDAPMLGTDLSQRDLGQLFGALLSSQIVLRAPATLGARAVDVLSVYPPSTAQAGRYKELRVQVDRQTCVTLQVDFLDAQGLRKRMRANPATLSERAGFRYAYEVDVRDLRDRTRTVVRLRQVEAGVKLPDKAFSPSKFYR